jgi:hypothetical protein
MTTAPNHSSTDMISELLTHALTGICDSLKGKVAADIQEHGEEYLQGAFDRIKDSATAAVEWAKANPMKTALAVAALAAVSTSLVRAIAAAGSHSDSKAKDVGLASDAGAEPCQAPVDCQQR